MHEMKIGDYGKSTNKSKSIVHDYSLKAKNSTLTDLQL